MAIGLTAWTAQAIEPEIDFEFGYASRYVTEGIDNLPDADGIFFSELAVEVEGITLGGVFVQGINDSYNEVNVYLEYGLGIGLATAYAGVQFLTYPAGDEDRDSWEAYAGLELDLTGWATAYGEYYYDFDDVEGGFLMLGLETDIPQLVEKLTLTPYIEYGIDAGFVSGPRRLSENNLQIGLNAAWELTEAVELFAGAHHSFALTNLDREDEGDVSWVHAGLSLSF